jgi:hypothetical protein
VALDLLDRVKTLVADMEITGAAMLGQLWIGLSPVYWANFRQKLSWQRLDRYQHRGRWRSSRTLIELLSLRGAPLRSLPALLRQRIVLLAHPGPLAGR